MESKPECFNEIENVQPVTSAPVQDEIESTSDQVQDAVDAEPCLNKIETVQPITSAPVQDEMESTTDQVQDAVDAEPCVHSILYLISCTLHFVLNWS